MRERSRIAAKGVALGLGVASLPSLACGLSVTLAAALAYSGGGGGGGAGGETSASGNADLPAQQTLADRFVGALVVPNGVSISGFELRVNGALVPVDSGVLQNQADLLTQELAQRGIYEPANEYLLFLQTSTVVQIQDGTPIALRFLQTSTQTGQPPLDSDVGFGGTRLADLSDTVPLSDFQGNDDPISAAVSALSGVARALLLGALVAAAAFALTSKRPKGARSEA